MQSCKQTSVKSISIGQFINQILFCTQALQTHPITINFVLGSAHYQRQQDHSLTTTVKGISRTQQWAHGWPSETWVQWADSLPCILSTYCNPEWGSSITCYSETFSRPQYERRFGGLLWLWKLFTPLLTLTLPTILSHWNKPSGTGRSTLESKLTGFTITLPVTGELFGC